jgi:hypothetical protein
VLDSTVARHRRLKPGVGLTCKRLAMLLHVWLWQRIQVVILAVELLWLVILTYTTSDGARFFLVDDVIFASGLALVGTIWVVGIMNHLIRQPGHRFRYLISLSWPTWLVREPYIVVAALLLWFTPIAFGARFGLSAPFVAKAAEAVLAGRVPPDQLNHHVIGLYPVRDVDHVGEAVRFITGRCSLFDDCGFVYSPKGSPPVVGRDSYHHLWGPWWHWYRTF